IIGKYYVDITDEQEAIRIIPDIEQRLLHNLDIVLSVLGENGMYNAYASVEYQGIEEEEGEEYGIYLIEVNYKERLNIRGGHYTLNNFKSSVDDFTFGTTNDRPKESINKAIEITLKEFDIYVEYYKIEKYNLEDFEMMNERIKKNEDKYLEF
ncbi:MAG: hypothetical protein MR274_02965, partial [Clostridium sp.]|nr:hypothetical protein [Clostridium sp.]